MSRVPVVGTPLFARPELVASKEPANPRRVWNPWNDKACLAWFATLRRRFGLIPQIGLPDLQDQADIPIDTLYVPLRIGPTRPKPGEEAESEGLFAAITRSRRLVVLGDPGSGKSTLVSWLCYASSQRPGRDDPDGERVRIALPVVLRDLGLDASVSTWDALLARVAKQEWWSLAGEPRLDEWCREGRVLLLVDGLDEIANVEVRRAVNAAALDAATRFPEMAILVTSRVLGYAEAPLEPACDDRGLPFPTSKFQTLYVQPFGQREITDFARRWYTLRVRDPNQARERAEHFLTSVAKHPPLQALAGTPSLLALMAVVHRVYAELPAGRAILFEKITEAYLESVDRAYGQNDMPQPAAVKRRWLARLATHIQEQRAAAEKGANAAGDTSILLDHAVAVRLLTEELGDRTAAERFLDWVMRRSGLLLPLSESQVAFSHLSIQEYLAAVAVVDDLAAGYLDPEVGKAAENRLFRWAGQASGTETTILAFEVLGTRGGRGARLVFDRLLNTCTKGSLSGKEHLAEVFVALRADSVVGLGALPECQSFLDEEVRRLARSMGEIPRWCKNLRAIEGDQGVHRLTFDTPLEGFDWTGLDQLPQLSDLSALTPSDQGPSISVLSRCHTLRSLHTWLRSDETDLTPLGALRGLETLSLFGMSTHDLRQLRSLCNLKTLGITGGAHVAELLHSLQELRSLSLWGDLEGRFELAQHVARLERLTTMTFAKPEVAELMNAPHLRHLRIYTRHPLDLGPLASHPSLLSVEIWRTGGGEWSQPDQPGANWTLAIH